MDFTTYAGTLLWSCKNSVDGLRVCSRNDHEKSSSVCGLSFWFLHPHQHALTAPFRIPRNWCASRNSALQPSWLLSPWRYAVSSSKARMPVKPLLATLYRVDQMTNECWRLEKYQCGSETESLRLDVHTLVWAPVRVLCNRTWIFLLKKINHLQYFRKQRQRKVTTGN